MSECAERLKAKVGRLADVVACLTAQQMVDSFDNAGRDPLGTIGRVLAGVGIGFALTVLACQI